MLGVLASLRIGSRVIHTVKPRPERYAAATGTMSTSACRRCGRASRPTKYRRRALRGARLLVSGSAPLVTPVFHRIAELTGCTPIERYGMSETMITLSTRADGERRPGSVGQPVLGVETRLAHRG